ncbi:hypothetical protein [Nannocystis pusilla]|uniref:hypothetical protein n=1 Tax=Nannocystis pusilla TaxID=889268 RepID=UPI003B78A417
MAVLVACAAACGSSTFDQPSEGIAQLEELRDGQTHEIPPQEGFVVAPIDEGAEMAATSRSNVIASLALPDGGEVHFLDLGPPEEPGVATLYATHSDAVGSLMRDFEATPLELFLALASPGRLRRRCCCSITRASPRRATRSRRPAACRWTT